MSDSDELLEETEMDIFKELFSYTTHLKETRQNLNYEILRKFSETIFVKRGVNPIFLDEDLIQDFLTHYKINMTEFNIDAVFNTVGTFV